MITVSVSDIINTGLLFIAVLGVFLTLYQVRQNYKIGKATFFKDLYSSMFADKDVRKAYYQIEQGVFKYDLNNFHGSDDEIVIDRLLSFIDLVCDLYGQGVITKHEMKFFRYQFKRIYKNEAIQDYLGILKTIYKKHNANVDPFPSFVSYCKENIKD